MVRSFQFALFIVLFSPVVVSASRIEELASVQGVRSNQLVGYGLVVGLNGTGDRGQARFTVQSTAAMLKRLGATLDPNSIQTRNAAAVVVTATLKPFSNPGTRLDVTVSSIGNARSLQGGTLLQTPLFGADRDVYAAAQGPVLVGGFAAAANTGSSIQQNHVTVGRVPSGAIVEKKVDMPGLGGEKLVLSLKEPNFITAKRMVEAINETIGESTAKAVDGGTVELQVSEQYVENPVGMLAAIYPIEVNPNSPARVVIDERTGTVVLGKGVRISEVAIAQGGLTVEIDESFAVSQPNAFAEGDTQTVQQSGIRAQSADGSLKLVQASAELSDVVTALNALGARPRDLIAIFQALRTAGALRADIEVQ